MVLSARGFAVLSVCKALHYGRGDLLKELKYWCFANEKSLHVLFGRSRLLVISVCCLAVVGFVHNVHKLRYGLFELHFHALT